MPVTCFVTSLCAVASVTGNSATPSLWQQDNISNRWRLWPPEQNVAEFSFSGWPVSFAITHVVWMINNYLPQNFLIRNFPHGPRVGVTKALFVSFPIREIFSLANVHLRFFKSHSYLTGVIAAKL